LSGTALWSPNGFRSTGEVARIVDSGRSSTPLTVAEAMPTPAAPRPRSSSTCVNAPPKEWPMMTGGLSSSRMIRS
jgi:hypothetical protein